MNSAIDRAFIRAYELEHEASSPKLPIGPDQKPAAPETPLVSGTTGHAAAPAPHFRMRRQAPPSAEAYQQGPARRPLSTFASPPQVVEARFRPSLEVDAFRWSPICDLLTSQHSELLGLTVETLLAADDAGKSLIGIGGAVGGAGATTLVACLARLLVNAGKTVAIVDGDFYNPTLATSLGLAADIGWEDVLAGRVPLAEAVVYSVADQMALLPLVHGGVPAAEKLDSIHASVSAGVFRYHYNIVLFDLGSIAEPARAAVARRLARQCRIDGFLLATPPGSDATSSQCLHAVPELADACLGLIENGA